AWRGFLRVPGHFFSPPVGPAPGAGPGVGDGVGLGAGFPRRGGPPPEIGLYRRRGQTKPALGLTSVRGARAAALSSSVHPPANDLTYGLAKGAPAGECASAGRNWRVRGVRAGALAALPPPSGPFTRARTR